MVGLAIRGGGHLLLGLVEVAVEPLLPVQVFEDAVGSLCDLLSARRRGRGQVHRLDDGYRHHQNGGPLDDGRGRLLGLADLQAQVRPGRGCLDDGTVGPGDTEFQHSRTPLKKIDCLITIRCPRWASIPIVTIYNFNKLQYLCQTKTRPSC